MSQNLLSAAVVIGALRANETLVGGKVFIDKGLLIRNM